MTIRLCVLAVLVAAASGWAHAMGPREVPMAAPLARLPLRLGEWQGRAGAALDADVLRVLRADDYVNRLYRDPKHRVAGLWIAFYASQTQGDAIHSPLNCLPGTGWTPLSHTRPALQVDGRSFVVNRYVVQKRGDRQVVFYWYQGRGRIVANEWVNKLHLLADSIRQRRTDGALVRVTVPVIDHSRDADAAARTFIAALFPQLERWLP